MSFIRDGEWIINLDHLIAAKKNIPRQGDLRLRLVQGWIVDLKGDKAASMWAALCRAVPESAGGQPQRSSSEPVRKPRRPPERK